MEERAIHILNSSEKLFRSFGIKSITMEEIAKETGMSKKTLYKYFSDKNELVSGIIHQFLQKHVHHINEARLKSTNAVEEYYNTSMILLKEFKDVQPVFIHDLKKYHPTAWKHVEDFQQRYVISFIQENLNRGIAEDLFRDTLNVDIISKYYIAGSDQMFNQIMFPSQNYHFNQLFPEVVKYHIHAISNQKGIKIFEELIQKTQCFPI